MPRYALRIEYDGGPFAGWQRQTDHPSVQGAIEAALGKLERRDHTIAAAGRTDAGVHARGQVCHCDMDRDWDPFRLSEALNFHLKPAPVAVVGAARTPADWHARFSAIERRYLYRILIRRAPLTMETGMLWHVKHPLDLDAMRAGASYLVGHHDFTTFRSMTCQAKSPIKTLEALDIDLVQSDAGPELRIGVRARSFLHNQVRSFVGTLERVGAGSWSPEDVRAALDARDRSACGPVAPPQGLALMAVTYPENPFA